MFCNEYQNDWDAHLPHVEYAYNTSVSAATGLAPNKVHIGRLPRLPLTVFDRSYGGVHHSLDRDHLAYCDLARERQQCAYELVREQHALTVARANGRNSTITRFLKRNTLSIGQAPSKSLLLVPPQWLTNQTGARSERSCYTLTSRQICPALLLNPASRWHAANLTPTLTMLTTCRHLTAGLNQYIVHFRD